MSQHFVINTAHVVVCEYIRAKPKMVSTIGEKHGSEANVIYTRLIRLQFLLFVIHTIMLLFPALHHEQNTISKPVRAIMVLLMLNYYQFHFNIVSIIVGINEFHTDFMNPVFWGFFVMIASVRLVLELGLYHNFSKEFTSRYSYIDNHQRDYHATQRWYWIRVVVVQCVWLFILVIIAVAITNNAANGDDTDECNIDKTLYTLSIAFSMFIFPVIYQLWLIGSGLFTECPDINVIPIVMSFFVAMAAMIICHNWCRMRRAKRRSREESASVAYVEVSVG